MKQLISLVAVIILTATTTQFVSAQDTTELSYNTDSFRVAIYNYYYDYVTKDSSLWYREARLLTSEGISEETSWWCRKEVNNGAVIWLVIISMIITAIVVIGIYIHVINKMKC